MQNRLLLRFSPEDQTAMGEPTLVQFKLRDLLETAGEKPEYVYFIEDGVASTVTTLAERSAEVGVTGREGFIGSGLVDGDDHIVLSSMMQVAGTANRYGIDQTRAALARSPAMDRLLRRYVKSFALQVSSTVWANGRALLEARLARWLLMVSDRVGPKFEITHEFIAIMLATRRSGVTLALQTLEGRGLIRSTRGLVTVVDREGMIELADGSYGMAEAEHERLMALQ